MSKENGTPQPESAPVPDKRPAQLLEYLNKKIGDWRRDEKYITPQRAYTITSARNDEAYEIREELYKLFPELKPKEVPRTPESPLAQTAQLRQSAEQVARQTSAAIRSLAD